MTRVNGNGGDGRAQRTKEGDKNVKLNTKRETREAKKKTARKNFIKELENNSLQILNDMKILASPQQDKKDASYELEITSSKDTKISYRVTIKKDGEGYSFKAQRRSYLLNAQNEIDADVKKALDALMEKKELLDNAVNRTMEDTVAEAEEKVQLAGDAFSQEEIVENVPFSAEEIKEIKERIVRATLCKGSKQIAEKFFEIPKEIYDSVIQLITDQKIKVLDKTGKELVTPEKDDVPILTINDIEGFLLGNPDSKETIKSEKTIKEALQKTYLLNESGRTKLKKIPSAQMIQDAEDNATKFITKLETVKKSLKKAAQTNAGQWQKTGITETMVNKGIDAAVNIQKTWRGYKAQKEYKKYKAARTIQTAGRGYIAKGKLEQQHKAARTIQKNWRDIETRDNLTRTQLRNNFNEGLDEVSKKCIAELNSEEFDFSSIN